MTLRRQPQTANRRMVRTGAAPFARPDLAGARPAEPEAGGATSPARGGRARPVFLDRSGRRRRLVLLAGASLAAAMVASLALFAASLSGASPIQLPGFPDMGSRAGKADTVVPPSSSPSAGTDLQPIPPAQSAAGPSTTAPTASPTSHRRVPTQTPTHQPRPTKTK